MFILHGTPITTENNEDTFFFWGEVPPSSIKHKIGPFRSNAFDRHPFLARYRDLENTIKALGPQKSTSYQLAKILAYSILPSSGGYPLFSADMPVRRDDGTGTNSRDEKPGLWKVSGLGMRLENALDFLASLKEGQKAAGEYTIGADVHFWSKASKLALELMIRQSIIPDMAEGMGGKARVRWRFVLTDGPDRERHSLLARSMPPVSIAVYGKARERSKTDLLDHFINTAINDTIRSRVKGPDVKLAKNSLAAKWIDSLQRGKELQLPYSTVKDLRSGMGDWKAGADPSGKRAFHTCFVLDPPGEDDRTGLWRLKYYIQASDDPSLLVPAEKIWKESGQTLNYLNRKFDNPQDRLLEDLGNASRIFPQMERSLHSAKPASAILRAEDAYAFLKEAALLFRDNRKSVV